MHCNLDASAIIRRAAPAARPKPVLVRKMSYFPTNTTVSPTRFADQVLFLGESAESLAQPCGAPNLEASGAIVFFERSPGLEHRSNTNSAADPRPDAAAAETTPTTPPLGGLRPRPLSPRRGYAPGAKAPSQPASPNWRANTRQVILASLVPMTCELDNRHRHSRRCNWRSGESLAFSAENPRNHWWAASTSQGGELR